MSPIETIQALYAAFGRGDLPALLELVADEVDWGVNHDASVLGPAQIPWLRRARNKAEIVTHYFEPALAALEFHRFEPKAFMAGGRHVSTLLELEVSARRSGQRFVFEEMHCFELGDDGRVVRYRGFLDTAQMAAMLQAPAADRKAA